MIEKGCPFRDELFPMTALDLFRLMINKKASDLFVTVGIPPSLKVDGQILPVKTDSLSAQTARELAFSLMDESQRQSFEVEKDTNFAVNPEALGRFRVNVFQQQGQVGMVVRRISSHIPSFEELNLPSPILEKIALMRRGLVFFVGGTGTGKSSTQAAVIGYRNHHTRGHIVTVEDPIEFVHRHDRCIVTQREVGVDTGSYRSALENAMRQAPDVIQIGEVRTSETMKSAIVFAETGHLCLATLHANNTYQALERIINLYPDDARNHLYMDLSMNLQGIVSQRLVPHTSGSGFVPAVEVLLNSPLISDLIMKGQINEIKEVIDKSTDEGMITFDQSLFELYEKGMISYEDAMRNADSVNNLRLKIKLEGKIAQGKKDLGSTFEKVKF
ncbi:MAG: PilT/PilU family type 4a pilus ATPase [Proteobacteria bacterium]|nr:PilT/PilU family type 4a pilus ATPase [Pseudomonadota bacterium]